MNEEERQLFDDLLFRRITKEEFLKQYPVPLINNREYIYSVLKNIYDTKDADSLEQALDLTVFDLSIFSWDQFYHLICQFLKEQWHFSHEGLVGALPVLDVPVVIETLYETALLKLDYLSYDDTFALARRCIFTLGEINSVNSRRKIDLLGESDNPVIRKHIKEQLEILRRSKFDR
jgi:hypothetical protein